MKRSMRDRAAHSFGTAHQAPGRPGGPRWGAHSQTVLVWTCQGPNRPGKAVGPGIGSWRSGPGPHRQSTAYRNELIWIVSVRPGPTPIAEIGAPDISSSAFTYAFAFFGRSSKVWALVMSSDQPGRFS